MVVLHISDGIFQQFPGVIISSVLVDDGFAADSRALGKCAPWR
jgi:hypothetical protein